MLHNRQRGCVVTSEFGRPHKRNFKAATPAHRGNLFVFGCENHPCQETCRKSSLCGVLKKRLAAKQLDVFAWYSLRSTARWYEAEYLHQYVNCFSIFKGTWASNSAIFLPA